jgi:hypothetical protein
LESGKLNDKDLLGGINGDDVKEGLILGLGEKLEDGESDGLILGLGEKLGDGESDGLILGLGEPEGLNDGETGIDGLILGDLNGENDIDGIKLAELERGTLRETLAVKLFGNDIAVLTPIETDAGLSVLDAERDLGKLNCTLPLDLGKFPCR